MLKRSMQESSEGVTLDNELADKSGAYTYISNHRDIILDSGFLAV